MHKFRYLLSRAIKFIGNLIKGIFFADHFFAPKLRFEIPKFAPPLLKGTRDRPIPRTVWQTNYSRRVAMAIYVNYLFNRLMAPTHEFRMLDDGDIEEFIDRCDEITKRNYRKLQIGAAKADFWRLLTVQNYGGVYMDVDATLDWPLDLTLGRFEEVFLTYRGDLMTNYFFASVPNSPHLGALREHLSSSNLANSVSPSHVIRCYMIPHLSRTPELCCERWT